MNITNMDNKNEYLELVSKLNEYSDLYYNSQNSPISDGEYDKLYRELVKYEERNPTWIVPDSPTQRVGVTADSNLDKKPHYSKMYSLDNVFNQTEVETYWKRFNSARARYGVEAVDNFYCDCKMDGLSCEIWYKNGGIILALTRGDGSVGEVVTENVKTIAGLPTILPVKDLIVVRGEVIVMHNDFDRINDARRASKLPVFANPRNYASGSLRQKDPKVTAERRLRFYAWELVLPQHAPMSHRRCMLVLAQLGFSVPPSKMCKSVDEIMTFVNNIVRIRSTLPYDIDGVVIKQDNPNLYKEIGWNKHSPLFSTAYKFVAQDAEATITKINWSMGRTGKLTPTAAITPTNLNGCTISNVTLNNADYVEHNKIGVGAKIKIIRSADVIPKIKEIVTTGDYTGCPDKCPYCGAPTVRTGTDLRCTNSSCKGKLISTLIYIVGDHMLNLKGIGPKFLEEIVNDGTVTNLLDIFKPLTSRSTRVSQELLDILVKRARNMSAADAIVALGIPRVGKGLASGIVVGSETADYKGLRGFREALKDKKKLHYAVFSSKMEAIILDWYSKEPNRKMLDDLIALDLGMCK